jgi:hypothetical protein
VTAQPRVKGVETWLDEFPLDVFDLVEDGVDGADAVTGAKVALEEGAADLGKAVVGSAYLLKP